MPRTAAKITQADIARVLRAVAQSPVPVAVEVTPDGTIRLIPMAMEEAKKAHRPRPDIRL